MRAGLKASKRIGITGGVNFLEQGDVQTDGSGGVLPVPPSCALRSFSSYQNNILQYILIINNVSVE